MEAEEQYRLYQTSPLTAIKGVPTAAVAAPGDALEWTHLRGGGAPSRLPASAALVEGVVTEDAIHSEGALLRS